MTDAPRDDDKNGTNALGEPIKPFDQTNGLAEGLDGDDGGALGGPDDKKVPPLSEEFAAHLGADGEEAATGGTTSYSEEGAE